MLARFVEVDNGLFTVVGGGIDNITLSEFPAVSQCFIGAMLRYGIDEVGSTPEIEFVVRDERTDPVGEAARAHLPPLGLNPKHPPGWEAGLGLAGPFQALIPAEGSYSVSIVIDGAMKYDIPFRVVAG